MSDFQNEKLNQLFKLMELLSRSNEIENATNTVRDIVSETESDPQVIQEEVDEKTKDLVRRISQEVGFDYKFSSVGLDQKRLVKDWFENCIDLSAYSSKDHKRLRNLILDLYSSLRTFVYKTKNLSDPILATNEELNELILSFGFPYPNDIISRQSKIGFLLSLIDLYNKKGTAGSLAGAIQLFGMRNIIISEWWLHYDKTIDDFIAKSQIVYPASQVGNRINFFEKSYEEFVKGNPYWQLSKQEIRNKYFDRKDPIKLPSITSTISIQSSINLSDFAVASALIQRKMQESYDYWLEYQLVPVGSVEKKIQLFETPPSLEDILNTPPSTPENEDKYIVGQSPTGDWVGHSNEYATWSSDENEWIFSDGPDLEYLVGVNATDDWKFQDRKIATWTISGWTFSDITLNNSYLISEESQTKPNYILKYIRKTNPKELNTPPSSPSDGDSYTVGSSPTGAWVGQNLRKATYQSSSSSWVFSDDSLITYSYKISYPDRNWCVFNEETGTHFVWNNASIDPEWVDLEGEIPTSKFNLSKFGELPKENLRLSSFSDEYNVFEVVLALGYLFQGTANTSYEGRFVQYNGLYVPLDKEVNGLRDGEDELLSSLGYDIILEEWNEIVKSNYRHYYTTSPRARRDEKWKIYTGRSGSVGTEGRFNGIIDQTESSALFAQNHCGAFLNAVNPTFKREIDSLATIDRNTTIENIMLDLEDYLRNYIQVVETPFIYIFTGNNFMNTKIKPVIDFFKPFRTRVLDFITSFDLDDKLENSQLESDEIDFVVDFLFQEDPSNWGLDYGPARDYFEMEVPVIIHDTRTDSLFDINRRDHLEIEVINL